jgi:hypothetical protein
MEDENIYPLKHELAQYLQEGFKKKELEDFSKARGIFIADAKISEVADELSYFFYDHDDLMGLKGVWEGINKPDNLSGFTIDIDAESSFDPVQLMDDFVNRSDLDTSEIFFTEINEREDNGVNVHYGKAHYYKLKNGKQRLIRRERVDFEWELTEHDEKDLTMLVTSTKAESSKKLQSVIQKVSRQRDDKTVNFGSIDQEDFSAVQTIDFLDKLGKTALGEEWAFDQVCQLKFKQDDMSLREDEEDEDNEDIITLDEGELTGITQALLDGKNLRNNRIVKSAIKSGYRFILMTYKFTSKKKENSVEVKVEFKLKPKVYQIDIANFYEIQTDEDGNITESPIGLDKDGRLDLRRRVWFKSREIYLGLIKIK